MIPDDHARAAIISARELASEAAQAINERDYVKARRKLLDARGELGRADTQISAKASPPA